MLCLCEESLIINNAWARISDAQAAAGWNSLVECEICLIISSIYHSQQLAIECNTSN